jgi:hypothetical protein
MEEKTERVEMRLDTSFLKTVDNWRRKQRDLPSRAEAIRRLAERSLAGSAASPPQLRKGSRRKAAEMADREIDPLGDQAGPVRNEHGESGTSSRVRENFATFAPICQKTKTEPGGLDFSSVGNMT